MDWQPLWILTSNLAWLKNLCAVSLERRTPKYRWFIIMLDKKTTQIQMIHYYALEDKKLGIEKNIRFVDIFTNFIDYLEVSSS